MRLAAKAYNTDKNLIEQSERSISLGQENYLTKSMNIKSTTLLSQWKYQTGGDWQHNQSLQSQILFSPHTRPFYLTLFNVGTGPSIENYCKQFVSSLLLCIVAIWNWRSWFKHIYFFIYLSIETCEFKIMTLNANAILLAKKIIEKLKM